MLEQHEGWRKPHWREESGLHQERKKACKVGTKEMVRAPDKDDKGKQEQDQKNQEKRFSPSNMINALG